MKMKSFVLSFLLITLFGCAKDRTVDSWQKEKVDQAISEISAVSGSYSGRLFSIDDGSVMGTVTLKLTPDTTIEQNSTRTGMTLVPGIRVTVILTGQDRSATVFQNGSFDADTKHFSAVKTVSLDAGGSEELEVTGVVQGDSIVGEITEKDHPDYGGKFVLTKGPSSSSVEPVSAPVSKVEYYYFSQEVRVNSTLEKNLIKMAVDASPLTADEALLNVLSPVKRVLVVFTFWAGDKERETLIPFSNAIYDERTDSLKGKTTFSDDGNQYTTNMNCVRSQEDIWNCSLTNSARGLILSSATFKSSGNE